MIDLIPVWMVTQRELRDQFRDWRILLPLSVLTLFFPVLMLFATILAVDYINQYGAGIVAERIVPFFLLVVGFFPVTVTLMISLEAFVGEKERGTIEPLLSSPLKDWQIYFGKLLAGAFLPLLAIVIDIGLYLVLLAWRGVKTPETILLVLTGFLSIIQAILMVSSAIVISTQSTSVRGANLLVSFIIIPIGILLQGESLMMFWGNQLTLWLTVLAVMIVTGLVIRLGLTHFQREYLLGRDIDVLNLKWIWRNFKSYFKGNSRTIGEWYKVEIRQVINKLLPSIAIMILLGLTTSIVTYIWIHNHPVVGSINIKEVMPIFESVFNASDDGKTINFGFIFLKNLQAMLTLSILGFFSFGVLGILSYLLNISLIGVVLSFFSLMGYSAGKVFISGILPHGIFELPALIMAGAMVLFMGITLVTPQPERTLGEVVIKLSADWLKLMLGVVIPLLLIAAIIESTITPMILLSAFPK
jgi:uncharacterized membrane protein SpoIIM required for sporulation/ABC-type transport system involved in multi-copper enzyme maturation permease subunit